MSSLYGVFDCFNDGKFKIIIILGTFVSTDSKVLGSDEGIKLGSTGGKLLGTILGDTDVITLGLDVGT